MSKLIIHISDLHVTTFKHNDGRFTPKIDSYLTTNTDEASANHYVQTFIDLIKTDFANFEYILLITGDISNKAEKKEFEFASKFIGKITSELSITHENILLLPGDHDVHRRSLENALEDAPNPNAHLMNDIKFKNFSVLYKEVKGADFPFGKSIIDHLIIDNKIVLICINSNYKINVGGGEGYLPIEEFKKELKELKESLGNGEFQFIACWHHNVTSSYENRNSGQWETENRQHLLTELERENIKLILTGNEHINSVKSLQLSTLWTSDAGAFSTTEFDATFKVYPIILTNKISLENKCYGLIKLNNNDLSYCWGIRNNQIIKQPDEFILFEENKQIINDGDVQDLPHQEDESVTDEFVEATAQMDRIFYNNPAIADQLYSIIKDKQLFHSGHFHWSETSRAHNWIDVSKLLEDSKTLYFVQNAVIDMINAFNLAANCDLIIGLGYEGNIISSKPSIKFNIPYTSLPYSYRYNDHHDYEKKLNYENSESKFKNVIKITDVVNDGRTIRKLIDAREKEFFKNVDKIVVLSLFYTGHQDINNDILNFNQLSENYDLENDYKVNNTEFYTVKALRVEKCPYGNDYKEACFIYKDGLSCVHTFYAEEI